MKITTQVLAKRDRHVFGSCLALGRLEVNGFDMEIAPAEHMVFLTYADRPGVVGIVGQILGGQGINIAGMQVCRDARGGHALIVLTVDSRAAPGDPDRDHLLDRRRRRPGRGPGRALSLPQPGARSCQRGAAAQ